MKEFWNSRYAQKEYIYGTEPNVFFKEALETYKPSGPVLMPGDGEGRNGVYAAQQGLDVISFDLSEEGKEKALALASQKNVSLEYQIGNFEDLDFPKNHFGLIGLIFTHFHSQFRRSYHQKCIQLLKPGGLLVLEAFSQHHIRYNKKNPQVGGPKDLNLLYTKEDIYNDFKGLETLLISKKVLDLNEGTHHVGQAAVIRYIGRKH